MLRVFIFSYQSLTDCVYMIVVRRRSVLCIAEYDGLSIPAASLWHGMSDGIKKTEIQKWKQLSYSLTICLSVKLCPFYQKIWKVQGSYIV